MSGAQSLAPLCIFGSRADVLRERAVAFDAFGIVADDGVSSLGHERVGKQDKLVETRWDAPQVNAGAEPEPSPQLGEPLGTVAALLSIGKERVVVRRQRQHGADRPVQFGGHLVQAAVVDPAKGLCGIAPRRNHMRCHHHDFLIAPCWS